MENAVFTLLKKLAGIFVAWVLRGTRTSACAEDRMAPIETDQPQGNDEIRFHDSPEELIIENTSVCELRGRARVF